MPGRDLLPETDHAGCSSCAAHNDANLRRLGLALGSFDHIVALAGNPNTGKSTVFNALTGLRQHVGNWPGKTVVRAEGGFRFGGHGYKLVDLPGSYSLLSTSNDEDVARDFLLFGEPDVTVVVVDATRLERNLNLVLQILQITDRVVVALNLMDEANRHGITIDVRHLARELGVPVVPMAARSGDGLSELLAAVNEVAHGNVTAKARRIRQRAPEVERAIRDLSGQLSVVFPELHNSRWVALRLLEGDPSIDEAVRDRTLGELSRRTPVREQVSDPPANPPDSPSPASIIDDAGTLREGLPDDFSDGIVESLFTDAAEIASTSVSWDSRRARLTVDRVLDRILTHRVWGFAAMGVLFFGVFWFTITGAAVPSDLLYTLLVDNGHTWLRDAAVTIGVPGWLIGLMIDGTYLGIAWVVAVMLPPMAIFFPLFTLLEDFGYLPRVAFNLDRLYSAAGAHGKQALSMMMGYGCNAAGVVSTRIIDSPRERLIAILTNNFSICNGRWPTLILMGTIFIGSMVPAPLASLVAAGSVVGVALVGVVTSLLVSWGLSKTVLRGEASAYSLELPPYRPPRVLRTLYTSIIDRTLLVLRRAVVMAAPAGAVIWLIGNVDIGDLSVAAHLVNTLDPFGWLLGLNGVILVAYIVAIPANEIIIPTILMLTLTVGTNVVGAADGVMLELGDEQTYSILTQVGGWTLLTAINLMLFSLLHNPCSTTILTIYNETKSLKWTAVATFMPLSLAFIVTFLTASIARVVGQLT